MLNYTRGSLASNTSYYKVCPKCDSIYKDAFCFNCGTLLVENKDKSKEVTEAKVSESVFDKLLDPSEVLEIAFSNKNNKVRYVILVTLLIFVSGISYLYYYFLVGKKIDRFASPVQVASDVANNSNSLVLGETGNQDESLTDVSTIPMETDLKEGSFTVTNLFNFLPKEENLVLYLFDLPQIYKRYVSEGKFKDLLSEFDIKEDDLSVYLSNNFVISFQKNDLDKWGYVAEVLDKDFVKKKVDAYQSKVDAIDRIANQKVKPKNPPSLKIKVYVKLVEIESDDNEDEKSYLLVSNDPEYLDLLKENSEGSVANLAKDALFQKSKDEVVTSGVMFVYKKDAKNAWDKLSDHIDSRHEFVGLNKILQNFTKNAVVFYSKDGKIKVNQSKD